MPTVQLGGKTSQTVCVLNKSCKKVGSGSGLVFAALVRVIMFSVVFVLAVVILVAVIVLAAGVVVVVVVVVAFQRWRKKDG